jgi:diguanylate cyclase (GGDEF)-like protein/PAS domain S-box-containing protein
MSSFIYSMIMGTPTSPRPWASACALSAASMGIGIALSSPHHVAVQFLELMLMGTACVALWRNHLQTRSVVQREKAANTAWQALLAGSQNGITILQPRHDPLGRFMGWRIAECNGRAHELFGAQAHSLANQPLLDALPHAIHTSFLHRLDTAMQSNLAMADEHVLHQPGAKAPPRWLHHQILPIDGGLLLVTRDTTEAHESIRALRERETFYRTLIDSLPLAVFARSVRPDSEGEYVVWNKAAAEVMRMPAKLVLGRKASELMPPEVVKRGDEQDVEVLRDMRVHKFANLIYPTPDGERVVDMIKAPVMGADGRLDHILSIAHDVTAQRQTLEQLRLASRVIEEIGDAVVVSDAMDRVVMVNPAFLNMSGLSPVEAVGKNAELLGLAPLRDSHFPGMALSLASGQRWSGESQQASVNGRLIDTWMSVSTLRNDVQKVTQHIRVFSDISALKAHQRELAAQARHDSLTGLPNRRAFGERLVQAIARAQRHPQTLAVLYIDLDGFKAINDRFGHASGDAILMEVSKRLLASVRLTDCVCRLSGDEFTVILEGAGNVVELSQVCQRIVDRLCQPHPLKQERVVVSPSVGAAVFRAGETPDQLCQRADAAMYAAKHGGKSGYILSEPAPMAATGTSSYRPNQH